MLGSLGWKSWTLAFFLAEKQDICDSWLLASPLSLRSSPSHCGPQLLSRPLFQHAISSLLLTAIKQDFTEGTWISASDQAFLQPNVEQEMRHALVPALFCWSRTSLFKTLKQTYRKIRSDSICILKLPDHLCLFSGNISVSVLTFDDTRPL